jgi:RNA polymerase sigma-70 factor (ECF subfamily)
MNPTEPTLAATQQSWHRFLESFEPLRPELYRFCRLLTRSAIDAEDLSQETLTRGFAAMARLPAMPANPRAWLFRTATNAWIDAVRRPTAATTTSGDAATAAEPFAAAAPEPGALCDAAGRLLVRLSPQERAALVLKEAFGLSLEEVADTLGTSVGAIKAALHRGRDKLAVDHVVTTAARPVPQALAAFCEAFRAGDLARLTALLLDHAVVEVVGATSVRGPDEARRTVLPGLLLGHRVLADLSAPIAIPVELRRGALPSTPRIELRWHHDRWLLLTWYAHEDGEAVRAVTTFVCEGDKVARIDNYFFSPDLFAELGRELGVPVRSNGRRWWHATGDRHECPVDDVVAAAAAEQAARDG